MASSRQREIDGRRAGWSDRPAWQPPALGGFVAESPFTAFGFPEEIAGGEDADGDDSTAVA